MTPNRKLFDDLDQIQARLDRIEQQCREMGVLPGQGVKI